MSGKCEELIEEARAALAWHDDDSESCGGIVLGGAAIADALRNLLAVFEQAHAPIGDEREALANLIGEGFNGMNFQWMPPTEPKRAWLLDAADAVLAAGFRRPVQGEPFDAQVPEPKAAVVDNAYLDRVQTTAEPLYRSTSEAERASKFLVSDLAQHVVRLAEEVRRLRHAEAQDERIEAWHYVADHEAFKACYDEELPLIDSVLARITELHELESTVNELAPAPTLPFEPTAVAKERAWTAWTPRLTDLSKPAPAYREAFDAAWDAALRTAFTTEQGENRD